MGFEPVNPWGLQDCKADHYTKAYQIGRGSSVGPEIDPRVRNNLSSSSADSRRASCQLLVKEWALLNW